jgi:hypothetical protein
MLAQKAESKPLQFLVVSADFPEMDYESAALTIELRAQTVYFITLWRFFQTASLPANSGDLCT